MGSVFIRDRGLFGAHPQRRWLHILIVLAMVITQLVFVADTAQAAVTGDTTPGAATLLEVPFDFIDLETPETQWIWNDTDPDEIQNISHDHTGGSFTVTYDGSLASAPILFNADAATVEVTLEALSTINDVTVTGVAGDYDVEFLDPGAQDNPPIAVDTDSLTGGTTLDIIEVRKGGGGTFTLTFGNETTAPLAWDATAGEVETALEGLDSIDPLDPLAPDDLIVTGAGNSGDEWRVTFPRGVPKMSATDSLTDGDTTIIEAIQGMSAPTDPSGLTYVGTDLLVSDSEINEDPTVYDDVNMFGVTTAPAFTGNNGNFEHGSTEPTGLAYNPAGGGHLYISNDDSDRVYDVALGDGIFDTSDAFTWIDSEDVFGPGALWDPEDVAWDSASGQVFVASGLGDGTYPRTVTAIDPGADGTLGTGDDVIGDTFDVSAWLSDLEGLEYRADSDTLLLVDPTNQLPVNKEAIYEFTKDGRLVRIITINQTKNPSDLALTADGETFYLVDRGSDLTGEPPPRDGQWFKYTYAFPNLEPFVNAGTDQVVNFEEVANLDGDGYDDGQGTGPGYGSPPFTPEITWSKVSGPGDVTFGDSSALDTTASFSAPGVYQLELEVDDGQHASTDIIQVTMSNDPNQAPVANAGVDQTITLPSSASLSGSANDDGLPNPPGALTYQWAKDSGPGNVTFSNSTALTTMATFSTSGTHVLKLTVSDNAKQHSDSVTVTVNPAPPPPPDASIVGGAEQSTGIWRLFDEGVQTTSFYFGNPNDFAFFGDWDCDGVETPGLYRQSDGYVYLRNSNTQGIADISFFFGDPGDVPIAGDFDGDDCDTVSIYRPSEAKFYIINELGSADEGLGAADYSFFYGVPGDVPFVGDWTGNGVDTPGLRRNSDGFVYLRNTNTQGVADVSYFYGDPGDVVFTGDWDGDGDDTLGLYRPSNGFVYLRNTNSTGIADLQFPIGAGMYPVAGDQ